MKCLTKAGTRAVCAGLVVLSAVGWSCAKQDEPVMNDNRQAEGAIAQARSYYESTAPSLTKTVADQTIAVKPLPGEMTPLWDRASATVLSDGTTAWVDVPIEAGVTYTAVRGGAHRHEAGEECGHDHAAVQVVQKLTIHTTPDGSRQSLIATIVREPDCAVDANGFSSADGLAGFSGFVSWHDLTGKLIRVAKYENGTKTRSVETTEDNNAAILEVVDDAVLIPMNINTGSPETKAPIPVGACKLCKKADCKAKDDLSKHCNICGQYDPPGKDWESKCTCRPRCPWCHTKIPAGKDECPNKCEGFPIKPPVFCTVCGAINCPGHEPDHPPVTTPPVIVQRDLLAGVLGTWVAYEQLQRMLDGSYGIDQEYQNMGDEYRHGLYIDNFNNERKTAFDNMKSLFIQYIQGYLFLTSESEMAESFYYLGVALHPIADHYIPLQTRRDMLNFYAYNSPQPIIVGQYVNPYTSDKASCTAAVRYIFNAVQNLNGSASEEEIAAIFDNWLDMAGFSW